MEWEEGLTLSDNAISDVGMRYMGLRYRIGNRNIGLRKDKGVWSLHIHMRDVIKRRCGNAAICDKAMICGKVKICDKVKICGKAAM